MLERNHGRGKRLGRDHALRRRVQSATDGLVDGRTRSRLIHNARGFLDDLAQIKDKSEIVVKINSGGGDLYTGIAIHNALKSLKGHKTVIIEGLAASAASVIACAGDEVQVHAGSMIMIHGAAVCVVDFMTAEDVKKIAKISRRQTAQSRRSTTKRRGSKSNPSAL